MSMLVNSFSFGLPGAADLAPFLHAVSNTNSGIAGATLQSGDLPGFMTPGDIVLLFVKTTNEALPATLTTAGWNLLFTPTGTGTPAAAGAVRLHVFWYRVDSSNSFPNTLSGDSGNMQIEGLIIVRGCVSSGSPFDTYATSVVGTASTSVTFDAVTTTGPNRLIVNVAALGAPDSITSNTNASAWTNSGLSGAFEVFDVTTSSGTGGGLAVAYGLASAAGTIPSTTATLATAAMQELCTLALIPETDSPYLGNKIENGTSGLSRAADTMVLARIIPSRDMTISGLTFRPRSTAATSKQRAVIYGDTSGAPGTLIAAGTVENTGVTSGTDVTLDFDSAVSLTAGTAYWFGIHIGTAAFNIGIGFTNAGLMSLALCRQSNTDTYSDGAASTYVGGATAMAPPVMWTNS